MNKALSFILTLLIFISCGKTIQEDGNFATEKNVEKVISEIEAKLFQYNWVNFKGKAQYIDPKDKKENFNFNIRSRKDSLYWISLTATTGKVEVSRILMDRDTILTMVKFPDKKYYPRPFDVLQTIVPAPLSYLDLENILAGNPFLWNKEKCQYKNLDKEHFQLISRIGTILNTSTFSRKNYQLKEVEIKDKVATKEVKITYSDYQKLDEGFNFSHERNIVIVEDGDTSKFELNFNKIKLNETLKFPFKVSSKYEQL